MITQSAAKSKSSPPPASEVFSMVGGLSKDIVWAVLQAILVLVSFLPLFSLNMMFVGGDMSMVDVVTTYSTYSDQLAKFTGYMQDEFSMAVSWFVFLLALWCGSIIVALKNIVEVFRGKRARGGAFGFLLVFAAFSFLAMSAINGAFNQATSGYGMVDSNLVTATSMFWMLGLGSLVCYVVFYLTKK